MTRKPSAAERRRAPRVDERLPLTIAVPQQELAASSRNLSSSGVYCELAHAVPPMTQVALTIALPDRHIRCEGVVVRSEAVPNGTRPGMHYRLAVFFTRLGVRDRQAIARFVAQRLAAARRPGQGTEAPPSQGGRASLAGVLVLWLVGGALMSGCQGRWYVSRGSVPQSIVQDLGVAAEEGQTYALQWLRRRSVDVQSQVRFDGLVIALQQQTIRTLRREDGNHIVMLVDTGSGIAASSSVGTPAATKTLHVPAKELPALQAVVRRYHFEPQLITDAVGTPYVVVYAPVGTRVVATPVRSGGVRVEVRQSTGGAPAVLAGPTGLAP